MEKFCGEKILIIGGGASGMFCALKLAAHVKSVTILELSDRLGKKLLATGNGKCNLTNIDITVDDYNSPSVGGVIDRFSPKRIIEEFASLGLLTRVDSEGRVYPYSESAAAALNVLLQRLNASGAEVVCSCEVTDINYDGKKWRVESTCGEFVADKLVFATGSDATSGRNSHSLISKLGHSVTPLRYGICPLKSNQIKGANGVRAKVYASIAINGETLMGERGEMLFKDNALSGMLAFRLSSALARFRGEIKECEVAIDFAPDLTLDELARFIFDYSDVYRPLDGILHKALAANVLSRVPMDRSLIMSRKKAMDLAKGCKNFKVEITGLAGKSSAQVLCGGISTDGIDMDTMQSKKCKGLYIIGEAADVDGLCGGCNLHWAWASALACCEDLI